MSAPHPPLVPRKPSGVQVMPRPGGQPPPAAGGGGVPTFTNFAKENNAIRDSQLTPQLDAEREVTILNHCFDDIERFMGRLQQTAEAQGILDQRNKKKKSKKSKNKADFNDDLLTMKACPPTEDEFVNIFQKFKYSISLLDRLKSSIVQPKAQDLLHCIFVPLKLMVKTTGGPDLASSVLSPAMTSGAVSMLQEHLTQEEKDLWTSLGSNWTSSCASLNIPVPPYSPVFLDGWKPVTLDSSGQPLEDPIEMQHKQEAFKKRMELHNVQKLIQQPVVPVESTEEVDGNCLLPEGERFYCCSYDFVARNSSELSVMQGETLEVLESSKRWWKCLNRFEQIGFVPYNILEPLSALNNTDRTSAVVRRETKTALTPRTRYFSYAPSSSDANSPTATSPTLRPQSMILPSTVVEDTDRVLIMNDELRQKIAGRRGAGRPTVAHRTSDPAPLNYHSQVAEVNDWLQAKGFNQQTIQSFGVLNGAQLFSLTEEELSTVSPEDGARVYSQLLLQKAVLEDVRKASEMENQKQKMK